MFEKIKENWGIFVVAIFVLLTIIFNIIMFSTNDHDISVSVESLVSVMNFMLPIVVIVYIVWRVLNNHPLVKTATTAVDTAGTAIDTVKKVGEVHKLVKIPNFFKVKELISKIKGFKIPKLEIKDKISKLKFWKKGKKDV
jgi:hypothetical protein